MSDKKLAVRSTPVARLSHQSRLSPSGWRSAISTSFPLTSSAASPRQATAAASRGRIRAPGRTASAPAASGPAASLTGSATPTAADPAISTETIAAEVAPGAPGVTSVAISVETIAADGNACPAPIPGTQNWK